MKCSKAIRYANKQADRAQIALYLLATKKTKLSEVEKVKLILLRNYATKMIRYIDNLKSRL